MPPVKFLMNSLLLSAIFSNCSLSHTVPTYVLIYAVASILVYGYGLFLYDLIISLHHLSGIRSDQFPCL